ncbi:ankyrin repeat domain-containing protein [Ktedonospora formicarum]|uniref:Ankyrin repeat domain-containing protein n=1 Tax=Ktedonospora formicarum TaxID=2778364 RepID=A0A8J3HXH2_9CHLR|nr:ankyrin repeat domain-containing protein [Ktedonospora formicarum]GHO42457.1 hypothetical protein KSX_06200 [Ktedonospora formicarum]
MNTRPRLEQEIVHEFVANAHGSLKRVQELLEQEPALINAAWDWGSGDWETALGAAAHTGQREIALYLLEKGARIDIFAATMLGQIEIVQAILRAYPTMCSARGPHGITLIDHAKAGGAEAHAALELLETLNK